MEKKNKFIKNIQQLFTNRESSSQQLKHDLLSIIQPINKEENVNELYFEKFNKNDWNIFWSCYDHVISSLILIISQEDNGSSSNDGDGVIIAESCSQLLQLTQFLYHNMSHFTIKSPTFFNLIESLHDLLIPLSDQIQKSKELKIVISKICEKMWLDKYDNSERYITQLIPYLLLIALETTSFDNDIKRIYNLKDAFLEFDYEDPTIETIRGLLLRCFVDVKFLKIAEGRRFLSFVFTLHENLHSLIIGVLKPQLSTGLQSVSTAYGDILYRAYRDLSDNANSSSSTTTASASTSAPLLLHSLEDHLQDLGYTTIHALNKKYFQNLKNCLNSFHQNKNVKGIDGLLLKIYGPFIWRSLKSSNPIVRTQAAVIFLTIFPLYNSHDTHNQIELDKILQKQFNLIVILLKDPDHRVRGVSCLGVCHILKEFWEVIPSQSTHQILSYLVGTLGFDSSDATIRVNVINGLQELLRNPLSHVALKGLLPILTNLLHDYSDRVRLAFVQLLNKIKQIRGFKFYEIVTIERLCDQLNRDSKKSLLCDEMIQLLLNSFYPRAEYSQDEDDEDEDENEGNGGNGKGKKQPRRQRVVDYSREQITRCLSFIHSDESAALVFYSNLYKHTSVGSAVKICVMLWNVLLSQTSSNHRNNKENDENNDPINDNKANEEEEGEEEEEEPAVNKKNKKKGLKTQANGDSLSRTKRSREETTSQTRVKSGQSSLSFKPELCYEILLVIEAILKPLQQNLSEPSFQPSKALLEEHLPSSIQQVFNRLKDLKLISETEKKIEESVTCHVAMSSLLEISGVLTSLSNPQTDGLKNKKNGKKDKASSPQAFLLPCEDILSSFYEDNTHEETNKGDSTDESFRLAVLNSVIVQCAPHQLFHTSFGEILQQDFDSFQKLHDQLTSSQENSKNSQKRKGKETSSKRQTSIILTHFEKTIELLYTLLDAPSSSNLLIEYRQQLLAHQPSYLQFKELIQRSMEAIVPHLSSASSPASISKMGHQSIILLGHLWTLLSLQKDLLKKQSPLDDSTTEIREVLDWISQEILPTLTSPDSTNTLPELLFVSMLSPVVDSLLIENNSSSLFILETFNRWAVQLSPGPHNSSSTHLPSALPLITRLLSVLSSPTLKITMNSESNLHEIQSLIQSTWCNWMDILLLHVSNHQVQTLLVSYLKMKLLKSPTRFQTLLFNRLLFHIVNSVTVAKEFNWKAVQESKSNPSVSAKNESEGAAEEGESDVADGGVAGIQWKEQHVSGSACANILIRVGESSIQSLEIIFPALVHQLAALKDEENEETKSSRIGLALLIRKLMKSSQFKESHQQILKDQDCYSQDAIRQILEI